jgi:hypothetical protein
VVSVFGRESDFLLLPFPLDGEHGWLPAKLLEPLRDGILAFGADAELLAVQGEQKVTRLDAGLRSWPSR